MAKEKTTPLQPIYPGQPPADKGARLAWMLRGFREQAGLTQAQVSQKTKVHLRLVEALEQADFSRLPSPAHLRAFTLAITRACDGDENAVLAAWRDAVAPQDQPGKLARVPAPAPEETGKVGEAIPARRPEPSNGVQGRPAEGAAKESRPAGVKVSAADLSLPSAPAPVVSFPPSASSGRVLSSSPGRVPSTGSGQVPPASPGHSEVSRARIGNGNWLFRAGSATWLVWSGLALGVVTVLWLLSSIAPHKPSAGTDDKFQLAAQSTPDETRAAKAPEMPASKPPESVTAESPVPSKSGKASASEASAGQAGQDANEGATSASPYKTVEPTDGIATAAKPMGDGPQEFILRARNHCWVELQIDGQVQPRVEMFMNEKRYFRAKQKIVMMSDNVGGLRVWWQGENLGYLGPRGEAGNGLVFEAGKRYHLDSAQNLAWPSGEAKPVAETKPATDTANPSTESATDDSGLGAD